MKHAQYRVSFVLNILAMMINNSFFIIQWVVVFSIVDNIGGYGFNQVMLVWAIATGSFGVASSLFGGARKMTELIYMGKLDVYLNQPKNVLINITTSYMSVSSIGDFLYGFVILAIVKANIVIWLLYTPIVLVSGIMFAALLSILSCLSFYVKRGDAATNAFSSAFISFSIYPPTIFTTATKVMLYTLIPVGFAVYIPTSLLFSFNIWLLLAFIGFAVFITVMAFVVFNKGLKRYNSGNVLSARL